MSATVAVTESKGAPFALREVELPDLAPDEVRVRVAASGICHTDLICRDQWYPVPLPQVLGHEGAGTVEAVGPAVTKVAPGDRVGMTFDSCGRCATCQQGRPAYCHAFFEHNFASKRFFGQSSFATHSVARERNVVRLDACIPLEVAAPFGCGIQTGAGAVLNSLRVPAGSSLAVFGSGTVGLSAVLAGVVAGCTTIVAVDVLPRRLATARELGATHAVDAHETDAVEEVRRLTGGGADFSLETTGNARVLRQCVDCLAPTGTAGVIGAPAFGTEVSLDVNTILTGGRAVRGIVEGDSVPDVFLPRLVKLWEQGRFPVDRLMTFYDFDDIEQAARDAEAGQTIKAVLRMA
ncbi:MAG TPA: NAD(P)-dependent alcohol dehydrogenase [Gaiellaceae bacterium]|nr:NAD(P)-dependent alcohol dehydrogenase [Gaiellaceae bacterium]